MGSTIKPPKLAILTKTILKRGIFTEIAAECPKGNLRVPWDGGRSVLDNHDNAAKRCALAYQISGLWYRGVLSGSHDRVDPATLICVYVQEDPGDGYVVDSVVERPK